MSRKMLDLYQCIPGYMTAEDVFSSSGIFVVPKGTEITEHIKQKLVTFGIEKLNIEEPEQQQDLPYEEFENNYYCQVKRLKRIIQGLSEGKKLDIDEVYSISNSLYLQFSSNYNIIRCLYELRNRDDYTYYHSVNVALYSILMAKWLNMSEDEKKEILLCGILHDIGKAKIPLSILNKTGKLTDTEYELIKMHAEYGHEMVKDMDNLSDNIKASIHMHHERENGQGYPSGVTGDKINRYAKIIAITDVYDAIISERAYKERKTPFESFKEIESDGFQNFAPDILLTFLNNIASYYIGANVQTSDGQIGEIVHVTRENITHPIIRINETFIDLSHRRDLTIKAML